MLILCVGSILALELTDLEFCGGRNPLYKISGLWTPCMSLSYTLTNKLYKLVHVKIRKKIYYYNIRSLEIVCFGISLIPIIDWEK